MLLEKPKVYAVIRSIVDARLRSNTSRGVRSSAEDSTMGSSRPKIISRDSSRRSDDDWRKDFEYTLDISLLRAE